MLCGERGCVSSPELLLVIMPVSALHSLLQACSADTCQQRGALLGYLSAYIGYWNYLVPSLSLLCLRRNLFVVE